MDMNQMNVEKYGMFIADVDEQIEKKKAKGKCQNSPIK